MAVAGEGIKRDVAEQPDIGKFFLDGAYRLAHQIVGIERFGAALVAQRGFGIGKQRDTGDVQPRGAFGIAHGLIDAEPVDAGHGGDTCALVVAVDQKQRPDQIV